MQKMWAKASTGPGVTNLCELLVLAHESLPPPARGPTLRSSGPTLRSSDAAPLRRTSAASLRSTGRGWARGTAGTSRFSCMERSRVRRVWDSAGRMARLALSPRILLPSLPPYEVGVPKGVIAELNGRPACSPVNACRVPTGANGHDSHAVAGRYCLPRKTLSFSTPCRFIPAHRMSPILPLQEPAASQKAECPRFSRFSNGKPFQGRIQRNA